MISFCKIFYVSFIELLVLLYFLYRYFIGSDPRVHSPSLDAAQIAAAKGIHLNLVLVKLLELHHLGYDLRHYHAQHHAFIKQFNLPAHFQFDVAVG